MQPAMPSSVALWARGFAAELDDDRVGLERVRAARRQNPLGSAAGYGVPNLPLDREATRAALGFDRVHEPVTAVQLSRGKAESALLFEIALLLGDLGRLASDLLLFYTSEFAYVTLPDEMTTGSSIMPQKRNPDVFELVRGAQATALGALQETLALTAKLTSGYHRDLQRLKAPLFRSIDLARRGARDHGARAAGRAVPCRQHRARARAVRRRAGQRARREGRHPVPRSVPARRGGARGGEEEMSRARLVSSHDGRARGCSPRSRAAASADL